MKKILLLCLFSIGTIVLFGQEEESDAPKNWTLDGYVKQMQTVQWSDLDQGLLMDNLIHNRLNFSWYINDKWTFKTDMRNRAFYGAQVQDPTTDYGALIENANDDVFHLSKTVVNKEALAIHAMFDRLYLDYVNDKLEVRVGRQRINWGINLGWNPNDIFNTYNFFDFDYEERPGSDAVKIQYYTGIASSVELAVKGFTNTDSIVAAALWKTNKWNYDFQVLGGVFHKDIVVGGGWAGSIKNVGFKGEFSTFTPYDTDTSNTVFTGTVGFDYSFENGVYVYGGFLYNSLGVSNINLLSFQGVNISAKNLFPYKYSLIGQAGYGFTPILSGSMALIYSPSEDNLLVINPSMALSVTENWDLDLVAQLFMIKFNDSYTMPSKAVFLRMKWSF